jgi:hypothetical protein
MTSAYDPQRQASQEQVIAEELVNLVVRGLRDERGVRAEDAICVLATIVGERCIDAAGDFDLRLHDFTPGSRVLSEKVNELLSGGHADGTVDMAPAGSVIGILRERLVGHVYQISDFPSLDQVFRTFVLGIGTAQVAWGSVPLSAPLENRPYLLPLRVGYESRPAVDRLVAAGAGDKRSALRASVIALAKLLEMTRPAIAPRTALSLALEIMNGMAKTASMTDAAMAQAVRPPS